MNRNIVQEEGEMSQLVVSVPEAAQLLGISERHAWHLAKVGELPTVRLGRRTLIRRARLEEVLLQREGR